MRKKICLDGIWNFGFAPDAELEQITSGKVAVSGVMSVPGCYEVLKKYFGKRGVGVYSRTAECGGKVKLRMDALGLRGRVFWDGRELGMCEHAFSPEEFIFDAGGKGYHRLEIAVENIPHPRESGQMYVDDYDFHCYGGIYDSVTVTELPEYYIERIQTEPLDLDGNIKIKLVVGGALPPSYPVCISFDGIENCTKTLSGPVNEFSCRVPNPQIWSQHSPKMHHLKIALNPSGETDELETDFGIRLVKAENGKILVNGEAVFLVGYNRHDSHPSFGYAVPESLMLSDLQMIKDQGCNFVRGCHYPQREKFLNLCDRMGIFVWEEVLGWNNQPVQCKNPDFIRREIEQAESMVHKSANHPSVIMWGFLNEVYMPEGESPRPLITALTETLRREDPSRLITFAFATGWIGRGDHCLDLVDVLSFNTYPGWYGAWEKADAVEYVVPKLRELADFASSEESMRLKPLLISEIGGAAIYGYHDDYRWGEEYQAELVGTALRETLDNPRYSGIAIWHFCDAKTHIVTQGILSRPRGYNNKGLLDEYRRPKSAWFRVRDILADRKFDGRRK